MLSFRFKALVLGFITLVFFVACSSTQDKKEDITLYTLTSLKADKKDLSFDFIKTQDLKDMFLKINFPKSQSTSYATLLFLIPQDCSLCYKELEHIEGLLKDTKQLRIVVIANDTEVAKLERFSSFHSPSYEIYTSLDFDKINSFLLSSLDIKDSKNSPLFILADSNNIAIKSYLGDILEEVLDIDIKNLLKIN